MLCHSILSLTPSLATIAATVMMYCAMWYVAMIHSWGGGLEEILGNSRKQRLYLLNISYH